MYNAKQYMKTVLIDEKSIKEKIKDLASQIEKDFQGEKVLLICILRGAVMFYADLVREIDLPIEMDFMAISSYGTSATTSGEVKVLKDLNAPIAGKNVIIVEDIIDTGYTLKYLKKLLSQRNPKSLKVCAFLDKKERRVVDIEGDYVGFSIPNEFVVGYGLDYAEAFRNLKEVFILKEEIYKK